MCNRWLRDVGVQNSAPGSRVPLAWDVTLLAMDATLQSMSPSTDQLASTYMRADAGRLGEFELLYRSHVDAVAAFFARRSHNPHLVADLTADTFLEAIKSFGTAPPLRGSERPWLFAIARHVYAKHCVRTTRRWDAARRDAGRQILGEDAIEQLTARIDAELPGRDLLAALAALSELDREAVELVDLAGLSPKEAAAALGVSSNTLRVRLFRARAKLRKERENR
jgi:RNA polymerase sigma factor (sigma-70 family)